MYKVGKKYLVSCIASDFISDKIDIPVIGNLHNDQNIQNNGIPDHIHIDTRFIGSYNLRRLGFSIYQINEVESGNGAMSITFPDKNKPPIIYKKKLTCVREDFPLNNYIADTNKLKKLELKLQNYNLFENNFVCPHHGTSLKTIKPCNGKIRCPLHGLTFCAKTGDLIKQG